MLVHSIRIQAFIVEPIPVRIENAGQRSAVGLLRAGGLVLDENSPAAVKIGDVLRPMTRKNDRNGKPILIGPIDWAFLLGTEMDGRYINMDFYAGRAGGRLSLYL